MLPFRFPRNNYIFLRIAYNILGYELHEQKVAFGTESLLGKHCSSLKPKHYYGMQGKSTIEHNSSQVS